MPVARLPEVDIFYEIVGNGPPLLLVAGLGGVAGYWKPQLDVLSRSFSVILHDHRGTGRSGRPATYSVEAMAGDIIDLMDHLGVDRAHFVGHSTGGAIGQVIAIDHPGRLASMIQFASWTRADDHFRWCFEVRKTLLSVSVGAYFHATPLFLMPPWYIRDNAQRLLIEEEAAVASAPPAEILAARIDAILAFDRRDELGSIRVPTMVLCAKDDVLTPPAFSEELARLIPDAESIWMERGGHACSQVLPEEFNTIVANHLDRQQASARLGPLA